MELTGRKVISSLFAETLTCLRGIFIFLSASNRHNEWKSIVNLSLSSNSNCSTRTDCDGFCHPPPNRDVTFAHSSSITWTNFARQLSQRGSRIGFLYFSLFICFTHGASVWYYNNKTCYKRIKQPTGGAHFPSEPKATKIFTSARRKRENK